MSKLLSIDASTDIDRVGALGSYLAILKRKNFNIADGFIIPIGTPLEGGVSNEIMRYFDALHADNVILRSSSIQFDLDGETIREVRREALLDAIRYMMRNISRRGRRAAIIVQRHIRAEISGTAYSMNPITRDEREVLIEAHLWMNRTVLTGESEPDIILVKKNTGALLLESEEEEEICLTSEQIRRVYNILRKAENISSSNISLDYSFDNNKLYVLRVRPLSEKILEQIRGDFNDFDADY